MEFVIILLHYELCRGCWDMEIPPRKIDYSAEISLLKQSLEVESCHVDEPQANKLWASDLSPV